MRSKASESPVYTAVGLQHIKTIARPYMTLSKSIAYAFRVTGPTRSSSKSIAKTVVEKVISPLLVLLLRVENSWRCAIPRGEFG